MSTFGYLLGGFTLAWAVVFAYIWSLSRRSAALQRQLQSLEAELTGDDE